MDSNESINSSRIAGSLRRMIAGTILMVLGCTFNVFSNTPVKPYRPERRGTSPVTAVEWTDTITTDTIISGGRPVAAVTDTVLTITPEEKVYIFNPDPTRAVWLSALFPGLGQVYNRRFWKLPIIVGGFMGLGYATSWNNGMLRDYSRAYADIMDSDPSTNSYMDFFPPTTTEADLNTTWLTNVLKSRKDYYRRNRDLCIICMVGVYLLAMVDAYVDASLAHFDISPDLSMDVAPALIQDTRGALPAVGMQWAFNF